MPFAPPDAAAALALGERLAGCAVLIATLEMLARPRAFDRGGLLGWEVAQLRAPWLTHGRLARVLDRLFSGSGLRALLILRAAAAACLVAGLDGAALAAAVLTAAAASLLLMLRTCYGNDGADQMCLLVLLSAALARASGSGAPMVAAVLCFLALQACLSYATSGIAKLCGPAWRDGSGIVGILSTHTYGMPRLASSLARHRPLAIGFSWLVIGSEILFPLVLVAPDSWIPVFLLAGLSFHLGCALVMGLNTFVWSFAATYPAVYWLASSGAF